MGRERALRHQTAATYLKVMETRQPGKTDNMEASSHDEHGILAVAGDRSRRLHQHPHLPAGR